MEERPKNLFELCELAAQSIEEMPRNYFQGTWVIKAQTLYGEEACGTAFCRAGWMAAHLRPSVKTWRPVEISRLASRLLVNAGVSTAEVEQLFAGGALYWEVGLDNEFPKEGSPGYAAIGAKGLREFMAKHEEKLKAFSVPTEEELKELLR